MDGCALGSEASDAETEKVTALRRRSGGFGIPSIPGSETWLRGVSASLARGESHRRESRLLSTSLCDREDDLVLIRGSSTLDIHWTVCCVSGQPVSELVCDDGELLAKDDETISRQAGTPGWSSDLVRGLAIHRRTAIHAKEHLNLCIVPQRSVLIQVQWLP